MRGRLPLLPHVAAAGLPAPPGKSKRVSRSLFCSPSFSCNLSLPFSFAFPWQPRCPAGGRRRGEAIGVMGEQRQPLYHLSMFIGIRPATRGCPEVAHGAATSGRRPMIGQAQWLATPLRAVAAADGLRTHYELLVLGFELNPNPL